jgi:hypothetical protein
MKKVPGEEHKLLAEWAADYAISHLGNLHYYPELANVHYIALLTNIKSIY